jgi:hypothetical protein
MKTTTSTTQKTALRMREQPYRFFNALDEPSRKHVARQLRDVADRQNILIDPVRNGKFGDDAMRFKHYDVHPERGGIRSIFRFIPGAMIVLKMCFRDENPYGDNK